MEKSDIVDEIDFTVGATTYNVWRIGLAHEMSLLKKQLSERAKDAVNYWSVWATESPADAQEIESRYIGLGMKGGVRGALSSDGMVYVYIY